jgi:hypothetical protein
MNFSGFVVASFIDAIYVAASSTSTPTPGEVRQPIPAEPGHLERYDYEYRRNGTVNLFVCIDVHRPWRKVKGHRAADGRRLRPVHARTRRCPLS